MRKEGAKELRLLFVCFILSAFPVVVTVFRGEIFYGIFSQYKDAAHNCRMGAHTDIVSRRFNYEIELRRYMP